MPRKFPRVGYSSLDGRTVAVFSTPWWHTKFPGVCTLYEAVRGWQISLRCLPQPLAAVLEPALGPLRNSAGTHYPSGHTQAPLFEPALN